MNQPMPASLTSDKPIIINDPVDGDRIIDIEPAIDEQVSQLNVDPNDIPIAKPFIKSNDDVSDVLNKDVKAQDQVKPVDTKNGDQYARIGRGVASEAGSSSYAQYGKVNADGVSNIARFPNRLNKVVTSQDLLENLSAPEYSPEQLQKIIELLVVIELSKSLLPEIRSYTKKSGGIGADVLQTGAAITAKQKVQEYLKDLKVKNGGKSTMISKVVQVTVNNLEVILELFNGYEVVSRAKPLKLNGKNKTKIFLWHGLDGFISRFGVLGQIADAFFNSSYKSVTAIEDQIEEHKETVRSMGVPEIYISDTVKGLTHYKNLQASYYDEDQKYDKSNAASGIYADQDHYPHPNDEIVEGEDNKSSKS